MRYQIATPAGASLAVLDLGAAEPVRVYLGGLGSASTVAFAEVTGHPELAGHGRHILIDLIGSGWSDHDDTFGHTIDEHARTVIGVLDELALREVTLIGHSLGGSIAISLAAQRPDLVGHLIVAEPNLDPGVGSISAEIAASDEDTFAETGHKSLVDELLKTEPEYARTVARWSARALHRTAVSLLADRPATFRAQLAAFAKPSRYLSGERSAEDLTELRKTNSEVYVVPAAAHDLMTDNLDGFVAALR
ncbi:alpha/beta fold hydrolase [Paractinoplanes durhamensis]|uniref:Alpha/beta hydrolase n=1 Tax=Paractinoplanes durhamensis TaxID=113563 RepID=A0ABQ3ZB54_9ACTN|nr:alpha/beta hydrolase [Actinoplanes durhamensis]GIE07051.1 alpha/beta hydrolase [Actinoplanes durhamensis]